MTQTKTSKRALLTSALSLLLCCTMLIGTTWAWFTDSVTSAGNKIQSGTLQVDLLVKGGNTDYTEYTSVKTDNKPIFNYDLWEPGYTLVTNAKVVNNGTLALKYTLKFVSADDIASQKLAEVIDVYYAPSEVDVTSRDDVANLKLLGTLKDVFTQGEAVVMNDNLEPKGKENCEDFATIVLKMKEEAGNEYQNQTISAFDIQLLATQWTYENDTFDDQYDKAAHFYKLTSLKFGDVNVSVSEEFANSVTTNADGKINGVSIACPDDLAALAKLTNAGQTAAGEGNGSKFVIIDDIDMKGVAYDPISTMFSSLDGQGHKISNLNNSLFSYAGAVSIKDLILENVNVTAATAGIIAGNGEGLTLNNVEIAGNNTVTYDPNGWHVHNAEHKGAGVICALDAGVTVQDGVKITGNVTVNYNDVEFKFGNNYSLGDELITEMFGAKYAGTPSDASNIDVTGNIVTNGSYTFFVKKVPMNVGDKSYNVSETFKGSIENQIDAGTNKIPANSPFVAKVQTADDLVAVSQMVSDGVIAHNNGEIQRYIDIQSNLDMSGVEWTPINAMRMTVNGNGHKISNINGSIFPYAGDCAVNDLTLENVTVSGSQAGSFAANAEGLRLTNCTLAGNVNISYLDTGDTWRAIGALVGWNSGVTFNNVKIADNTVINLDATGIKNGHADSSKLTYDYYVGTGTYTGVTVGSHVTVNYTHN